MPPATTHPPDTLRVRVCATSANLGPGFDSLGLAIGLHDDVSIRVLATGPTRVQATGESADEVPDGEDHLLVRALRHALDAMQAPQPVALDMLCRNGIPHGRGLGSSAAAVVAGIVAARHLLDDPARLDDGIALALATDLEGHPDNAAAVLLGGFTIAWTDHDRSRAIRVEPHPDLRPLAIVPVERLATHHARSVLPSRVTHEDAAFNAGRSALLVEALTRRPELLLTATQDRLHQQQRASAMPATIALVGELRAHDLAAVVSGAGPSVLVLTTRSQRDVAQRSIAAALAATSGGWRLLDVGADLRGAHVV